MSLVFYKTKSPSDFITFTNSWVGLTIWHNGTVPGAPRLNGKIFLYFTSFWQESAPKIPKVPGAPRNVNPALLIVLVIVLTAFVLSRHFFNSGAFPSHRASTAWRSTWARPQFSIAGGDQVRRGTCRYGRWVSILQRVVRFVSHKCWCMTNYLDF